MSARSKPSGLLTAFALADLVGAPLVRFLAVGTLGLAADAAIFWILHDGGLSRAVARALSLAAATLVTWTLNRTFTFSASGRGRRAELIRYGAVVSGAQAISYGVFLAISAGAPQVPALVALVCGAVMATGFSFTGQRAFTFRAARPGQS